METTPRVDAAAAAGSRPAAPADDGCSSLSETSASEGSNTPSWDRDAECWICREDGRSERLIRPCLCHGSMSGVHQSCVEKWIASQLESGGAGAAAPRCPVCHQEYRGDTARPGAVAFGRSLCAAVLRQVLRCVLLISVLSVYWVAAQEGEDWSWVEPRARQLMLFCTGAFFSYKLLVLLVSLPMTDEPPSGWRRLLTVTTPVDLGGLVGESLASTAIGILWCLCGMMGFEYVVPLLAFTALLLLRMAVVFYDDTFLVELAHSSSSLIVLVFYTAKTAVSQPCAIFSPASVGFHIVAATVAFVIVLTCQAEDPLVMFLLAHSAVLFACVVENVCIRRLRWKAGRRWVLLVHVSLFVTYSANLLCELLPELVAVPPSWRVFAVSAAWLSLVLVLALTVNRGAFLEYYTSWQQLHGKFRLGRARPGEPQRQQRAARRPRPPPDAEGGLAGDAGGGGSTAAARHGAAPAAAAGARACEGHGAAVCL